MRSKRTVALALTAALLAAGLVAPASAQSLGALYDAARGFDAAYLAARAQAQAAEYRAAQAEALARPSAALSSGATLTELNPPRGPSGDSNLLQAAVTGRYPLYNKSNDATIAQARRSLEAAQAELTAAEQDLIVRLAQAYFDVLGAQDQLATVAASKAAITEQLASAKRNFEVGTATITDTREAQARYDLALAQEIAAENELRTRRTALDQLVGRVGVEPKPVAAPLALPPVVPADPEAWVGVAEVQHPAIRRAQVALDVARLEIDKARAAGKPTVDAIGSIGANHYGGRYPTNGVGGTQTAASVGVQLNWPLYTGGAVDSRIKETIALEDKARNDLETARRSVALGTRTAFLGLQSGRAQVKALEAAEASSKLALEATQLGYKVGVRVNLDVLNAQTQLYQTQRDLARARYEVMLGELRLRQAAGQLAPPDVDLLNRLLVP